MIENPTTIGSNPENTEEIKELNRQLIKGTPLESDPYVLKLIETGQVIVEGVTTDVDVANVIAERLKNINDRADSGEAKISTEDIKDSMVVHSKGSPTSS